MPEKNAHANRPAIATRLKRALIHDHLEHCGRAETGYKLAESRALTRLL
jgi:hypothetical protein